MKSDSKQKQHISSNKMKSLIKSQSGLKLDDYKTTEKYKTAKLIFEGLRKQNLP